MINLLNYFRQGLNGSLLMRDNFRSSHNGPFKSLNPNTLLDRWHIGDFSTAEYTISIDLDVENKEIIKVLVTGTLDKASVVIYARNYTTRELVKVDAVVNQSYVDVLVSPRDSEISPNPNLGAKVIFNANYFQTQTPLVS